MAFSHFRQMQGSLEDGNPTTKIDGIVRLFRRVLSLWEKLL